MCHIHCERSFIQKKAQAIISCFIDSTIPPAIQIDIPQEIADNITDRKFEASPYLFREAQVWERKKMLTK